jgi:pyridoxal 5'-phosphate synthase pdxT subunit
MNIGVLALQGDFIEHVRTLRRLGATATELRLPKDLDRLDGLIIPGGESTTIGKLAVAYGLIEPIRAVGATKPVWGTCAGAILLSRDAQRNQPLLGLMDIVIQRNAFGRQVNSFSVGLNVPALRTADSESRLPFPAVFIRAPLIERVGPGVCVLARLGSGAIVAARQGSLLATSFHPELTGDDRFHQYFLGIVKENLDGPKRTSINISNDVPTESVCV